MGKEQNLITKGEYRGHEISVYSDKKNMQILKINKREFHLHKTENGVHSDQCIYKVFGTAMELAESIIQQNGEIKD